MNFDKFVNNRVSREHANVLTQSKGKRVLLTLPDIKTVLSKHKEER